MVYVKSKSSKKYLSFEGYEMDLVEVDSKEKANPMSEIEAKGRIACNDDYEIAETE